MVSSYQQQKGFTLIELSIVLVIIGLIVGGVLVGNDLINAAAVRAQISQIEQYQAAVNTFRGKYGYLPGDIPNPTASQFGFAVRGSLPGQGDGNGTLTGYSNNNCNGFDWSGVSSFSGELGQFWVDLSTAKLINAGLTSNVITTLDTTINYTPAQLPQHIPPGKITGTYVYAWSGGWQLESCLSGGDYANYFTLSGFSVAAGGRAVVAGWAISGYSLSVAQAYAIDSKTDDGLPQSGRVLAMNAPFFWDGDLDSITSGPVTNPNDIGLGIPMGPTSCYDGNSPASPVLPERYSMEINKGAGLNCWLSFRFQ